MCVLCVCVLCVCAGRQTGVLTVGIPPVHGTSASLEVRAGGQASAPVFLSLNPPLVTGIQLEAVTQNEQGQQQLVIRIVGESFGYGEFGSSHVSINGTDCPVVPPLSPTTVKCRPAAPGGMLVVTTNLGLRSDAVLYDAENVLRRPVVSFVSPPTLPTSGGVITISGSDFRSDATVGMAVVDDLAAPNSLLQSTACALVEPPQSSELRCRVQGGQGGPFAITVTASNGTVSLPSPAARLGFEPPSLVSLSPASGPAEGRTLVTLSGSSFGMYGGVTIGNRECVVRAWSHDSIVCETPPGMEAAALVEVSVAGTFSDAAIYYQYVWPVCTPVSSKCPSGS